MEGTAGRGRTWNSQPGWSLVARFDDASGAKLGRPA